MNRWFKTILAFLVVASIPVTGMICYASEEVRQWVYKMKWHGDLRVRHDSQWITDRADRHRERFRGRFGFTYDMNDFTQLGFQLATGGDDPITTNQSMGDRFSTKGIQLDMAYVRHTFLDKKLKLYAGKFKNPFEPYTWLIFDSDLRMEGVATQTSRRITDSAGVFFNAGAFPLDEISSDSSDPWFIGLQGGVNVKQNKFKWTLGLAHYNYLSPELVNEDNYSGNTVTDFRVYNPSTKLSLYLPVYIGLTGDYVYNEAADTDNTGWLAGVKVGHEKIKEFKDWQVFATYSRLEADATYDEFPDSDFHSGGTNNQGMTVGYKFGLSKGMEHGVKYYATSVVEGPEKDESRIQIDLMYKF